MPKNICLVKSTSGVRGIVGAGLDPVMVAAYGAAFGTLLGRGKVVVGRDSRTTGEMIKSAAISGLLSVGMDVVDIGIVPTPTVEIAVKQLKAVGGICLTASHNPAPWNALKFFNAAGEFITPAQYKKLDRIFESARFAYQPHDKIGAVSYQSDWIERHIKKTLALKNLSLSAIKRRKFRVVVDAINGAGSEALPDLLSRLNVELFCINCNGDGNFVHEPEPTPRNLAQLGRAVRKHKADLGMACDPDADRLALVDQTGRPISEELTLAIAVRHLLRHRKGSTVINLSTSNVTADTARAAGSRLYYAKVGEANVVQMMHKKKAVIGGEGNGGVIYPSFHAGRDSLVAAAMTLSCLAEEKSDLATLVETFPTYYNIKTKASLLTNFAKRMNGFEKSVNSMVGKTKADRRDGIRLDFKNGWIQIRTSNTEPIYRLIVESTDQGLTDELVGTIRKIFK
ncbi:MAG: phosphoglucosamine mutase [bacterium]|nr:phosphoglucosamine mutase [bacterium]